MGFLVVPRTGRRKAVRELLDREREQLVGWERRRKSCQALALRSWIVLRCAAGLSNTEVAAAVGVTASARTPSRSSRPNPPSRSLPSSPDFSNELTAQDTRVLWPGSAVRRVKRSLCQARGRIR